MTKFLVTGSTGQVGGPAAAALRAGGADVVGLTRSGGPEAVAADLVTGEGLTKALTGIDTVVHLAAGNDKRDLPMLRNLTAAAKAAGVGHLVMISIVGCDLVPLAFYRQKVELEGIALASGVPLTIQRATQFHTLIDQVFSVQKFSPAIFAPAWRFQPIAPEEVGARMAELAMGAPQVRAEDIGGPHVESVRELHAEWKEATGSRRPAVIFRMPGKMSAGFTAGVHLAPASSFGKQTFAEYLAKKYR
ncbi:NAD(P)H-binding protein [Kribbella sp. NPDC051770]|uniref:SDR family oxidoreductase n=1 Tax=Kribbella sp. NPDC051770 TaxID=3155413 RepID=UPI0034404B80